MAITAFRELNTFLVCPDQELSAQIQRVCSVVAGVRFGHVFESYPNSDRLGNLMCVKTPDLIIVDVSNLAVAAVVVGAVKSELPSAQLIAAHWACDPEIILAAMRLGVSDFIYPAMEPEALEEAFMRVRSRMSPSRAASPTSGQIISLLPARAGVGTSTAALNIASQCARTSDGRVFLGDFDLGSGTLRFMLKIQNQASMLDAAERVLQLDDDMWSQIVHTSGKLDVLHSGTPAFQSRLSPSAVRQLAALVRRKYRFAFADLSGQLEDYSLELLQASSRIYVVTTPEITALNQAREKVRILENEGLSDRTSLVLTRATRSSRITAEEVEQVVGAAVEVSLAEDHHNVQTALTAGSTVSDKSEYAKNCAHFAQTLQGGAPTKPQKRRFVEYFYTVPTRYRLEHA
jgi:pilus assembly protein CpaE